MTNLNKFMRRLAGAALAGALLLASVGAGQAEPVNLRWGVWAGNPEEAQIWQQLADLVHKKYPDITITLETAPWGAYWDKLTTQLASGTAPDIVSLHHMYYSNYAANGLIMDIGPLIKATPELNYDDFYKPAQNGLSDGDKVYALTYGIAPYFLYYNKKLFDAAGVAYPDPVKPMTFDEFNALAKKLTDKSKGIYGFTMDPTFTAVLPFIWSNGGDYISADGTKSEFGSEATRGALKEVFGLYAPDGGAKPIVDIATPTTADDFAAGKVAMMSNGSWMMGYVSARGGKDLQWDIAPLPAGAAGSITWSGVSGFAPSKTTAHQAEAWKAIQVITGVDGQTLIGSSGREFPSRLSVVDAWLHSPIAPANGKMVPLLLGGQGPAIARPLKGGVSWNKFDQVFGRELNPGFLGGVDADEAATKIDAGLTEALAE